MNSSATTMTEIMNTTTDAERALIMNRERARLAHEATELSLSRARLVAAENRERVRIENMSLAELSRATAFGNYRPGATRFVITRRVPRVDDRFPHGSAPPPAPPRYINPPSPDDIFPPIYQPRDAEPKPPAYQP